MRVLVASSLGGAGHLNPLVPWCDGAAARGDEVRIMVPPSLAAAAGATGHEVVVGAAPPPDEVGAIREALATMPRAAAARLVDGELFARRCTAAMLPAMEELFARWRPDLVLREPCEYSSGIAALRHEVPQAIVAISMAEIEASVLDMVAAELEPYGSRVAGRLGEVPFLTRLPGSLDPSPFRTTCRYREAPSRPAAPLSDWWGGSDAPLVYVTLGSVAGSMAIATAVFRAALDAVAGLDVRVLVTLGRHLDAAELGAIPPNVHVESWVPQEDVLGSAALVVCHGGSGTTFGALAAGVPLVVVPLFADQLSNAPRVAAAGAGLVVEPVPDGRSERGSIGPGDVPRLAGAIESVLADESYRRAAGRIAAEMAEVPNVASLLAGLPELARRSAAGA